MSDRSTFNPKVNTCWQKQLRDYYLDEGVPPIELNLKKARVIPVSREFAETIILKYEWLGTMAQSYIHYGIFFENWCAGVTCISSCYCTGGVNVYKPFKINANELFILCRGACTHWAPVGTNSKLVSWTCKLLKERGKLILAYADTDAGEIGTIYQSCNWYYIGRGSSTEQYLSPNGRVYDGKLPSDIAKKKYKGKISRQEAIKILEQQNYIKQKSNPKHRYVQVIDKSDQELIKRIESMQQPYPKRPKQATISDQEISGGATPTRTLQKMTQRILSLDLYD